MQIKENIENLPAHFKIEKKALDLHRITKWCELKDLTNEELNQIARQGFSSKNNLEKLRAIALFICELKIPMHEASILIHSGISTIDSLARSSPQSILNRTGRLERQLQTKRESIFNLVKASQIIKLAESRQKQK